jgi:hypothetical protein
MMKIHSLLEVAGTPVPWLYFGSIPGMDDGQLHGGFDQEDTNLLIVKEGKSVVERLWNIPVIPFGQDFVMDGGGRMYPSWQVYFQNHPLPARTGFDMGEINSFH